MKTKRNVTALVILAALLPALWAVVHAADEPDESVPPPGNVEARGTLRGAKGVAVVVGNLPPEVEQLGLTGEQLRTDAELQLCRHGVKVLSPAEAADTVGMPHLYISVGVAPAIDNVPVVAGYVSVQFLQSVTLDRNLTVHCLASTWEMHRTWTMGRGKLQGVRGLTHDTIAAFINDYLAVNPKPSASQQKDHRSKAKQG
ncbi:MAG: hypothetical protein M1376_05610 [Planctomycetes bacterium]|nr:hypothetical protein [Planctomycetota bacterium]